MDKLNSKFGGKVDFDKLMSSAVNDEILIGYPEGETHNSGKANLDKIAEWNSESETHPRPFLHDGLKANLKVITEEIKKQYLGMLKGKSPDYHKIAVMAINSIQEFVRGEYYKSHKPNAESTIKRKTSKKGKKKGEWKDKPLIDTGQTINGVTYTIVTSDYKKV
jgi:hypothetical protein